LKTFYEIFADDITSSLVLVVLFSTILIRLLFREKVRTEANFVKSGYIVMDFLRIVFMANFFPLLITVNGSIAILLSLIKFPLAKPLHGIF
jgi:hypothetical protein